MSRLSWFFLVWALVALGWPRIAVAGSGASLSLEKDRNTDNVVLKLLAGNNRVTGVDAVIKYDGNKVQIVDVVTAGTFSSVTGKLIDNKNGVTRVSVSNSYQEFTTGSMDVVSLKIKVLNRNGAKLDLDFSPGSTRESNVVVAHGIDVLEKVVGVSMEENFEQKPNENKKDIRVEPVKNKEGQVLALMTEAPVSNGQAIWWGIGLGFAVFFAGIIFWISSSGIAIETQLRQ